jgi:putative ABC transport system permease protein
MSSIWKKAVRDFWLERTRTALVIIAIALGIAAFSSVLSSYAILTRELDRGYLETNPASAVLRVDSIDEALVAEVLKNPEVSAAEPRRIISGQMKAGPFQWRNVMLFVVKDYGNIRVSKLVPEHGSWPPATGEILIERDAFQVARASIGDAVIIKTPNGVEQPLVVSGQVHDVGQAQARMENIVYGYITLDTLAQLGEEPFLNQLNILVADKRFDEEHIKRVTNDVKALIERRGHTVGRVDLPPPGKHPHSDLTGILLLAMSSFGLFVLLLSGILVVNLLTALMAAQIRQIGVMKTVGATRLQIARIYLGQSILLGIAAIIVAIPLGIVGSRALCSYMAYFLNFDINSFAVPIWVYLLVVLVGLITPLAAAIYPVWKGTGVSIRKALSDFGISQTNFGSGAVDRMVTAVGGKFLPFVFAVRNSFRRRARLVLTLITLAAGGLFFLTALNVRASLISTLDALFATKKFDLSVSLSNMYEMSQVDQAIAKTPGIVRAESWIASEGVFAQPSGKSKPEADPHAGGNASHGAVSSGDRIGIMALPANTEMLSFDLLEGRRFLPEDTNVIIVNSALATRRSLKTGDTISFQMGPAETTWQIVGITREAFSQPFAYIPKRFIDQQHPGMTNSLRLALSKTDADSVAELKTVLDRNLEAVGVRARGATSKADSRFGFDQHMLMIYVFLIVMSSIIAGVGGLGLMTTLSLNVLERRREMGVLRAIGATPSIVWRIIIVEGLVIGFLSWVIAALAAWPVGRALGNLLVRAVLKSGLDFTFEWYGLGLWLIVSVGLSAVASFLPAWKASRLTVREALAYE